MNERIARLIEAREGAIRGPRRAAWLSLGLLVFIVAALLARRGTSGSRAFAAALLGAPILCALAMRLVRFARWRTPRGALRSIAHALDAAAAGRAVRALALFDERGVARDSGASELLARAHVERSFDSLPWEKIALRSRRFATALAIVALVSFAAAFGLGVTNAVRVFEGLDVLAARDGVAPVSLDWLDDLDIAVRAPDYLHIDPFQPSSRVFKAPHGSQIAIRGRLLRDGRFIFLIGGSEEVPFVDDGAGGAIARVTLAGSAKLQIVAKFGQVRIEQAGPIAVTSIDDERPRIVVEGAPREIALARATESDEIPIRYEATDDHGLREVDLVLRCGAREERRVLSRLDGETRVDRGAHVLRATDSFIKKSFAPIEITIEAKDNDPLTGPKWGRSDALTLVPPSIGEAEAMRLDGLREVRDSLVDSLAARIKDAIPPPDKRPAWRDAMRARIDSDEKHFEKVCATSYGGVRVPARIRAMIKAQLSRVRESFTRETRDGDSPSAETHKRAIAAAERAVIVVDAAIRGMGHRDARDVARRLAESADELVDGASLADKERERADARMNASVKILEGGALAIKRLGSLGRDLGWSIEGALPRVARMRSASDFRHAELAARDLAARLHQPDASFATEGGSGRAGGEGGGSHGAPSADEGDADEASRAFNEAAQEIERLAQEHAAELAGVEKALSQFSEEDMNDLSAEAKKHAEAIRRAAGELPSVGTGSDSWTSKGASAREHAERMARALEDSDPKAAVASGQNALQALEEARGLAARERFRRGSTAEEKVERAQTSLDAEEKWAEKLLDTLKKRAAERAGAELKKRGDAEQKIGEGARKSAESGRTRGELPQAALEALDDAARGAKDAARALKRGAGDEGLAHQREVQRKLEAAKRALGEEDGEGGAPGDGQKPSLDRAGIPKADAHQGPEEFRKRVSDGLSRPSGGMKDAVRRYAEGLLR